MPNSDLAQAANDIRWLSTRFKGLIGAADALDSLGSIENAIEEAKTRHAGLMKDEQDARQRLDEINGKVTAKAKEHDDLAERHATLKADYDRVTGLIAQLGNRVA